MRWIDELQDSRLHDRRVLVAADLDVPLEGGAVEDDFRLQAVLPTLQYLREGGAKVLVVGHLDRPGGQVVEGLRMSPVGKRLSELLGVEVKVASQIIGDLVGEQAKRLQAGEVLLLENVRFDSREKENDPIFARRLAELADVYVSEIFGTLHREQASIVGVPQYLSSYGGLHLRKELEVLDRVREDPRRPLVYLVGGAKEDKKDFVRRVADRADRILLGGKLMFAQELEGVPKVRFPLDAVRVDDIGPRTRKLFDEIIQSAGTVIWAGPLGRVEQEDFIEGTKSVAESISRSECFSVVGGGDTLAVLKELDLRQGMDFCSTGGGSMLEYLAQGTLPGLEALEWESDKDV